MSTMCEVLSTKIYSQIICSLRFTKSWPFATLQKAVAHCAGAWMKFENVLCTQNDMFEFIKRLGLRCLLNLCADTVHSKAAWGSPVNQVCLRRSNPQFGSFPLGFLCHLPPKMAFELG